MPHPLTLTHVIPYLRIVAEGLLVVDTAPCTPALPLSMEQGLVPSLLEGEQARVHLPADAGIREPFHPIM